MSLFMQALLVAIFVTIAFIDAHTTQIHIFRPIVVGPVVGLIMGDVQTGFQVGVTVELMFLAVIFVGTAVPPNPTISTAIATGIAILAQILQSHRHFRFLLLDRLLRRYRTLLLMCSLCTG